MKNLKKTVALLLCAVLLVAGSVAGTLAYLQSHTEAVVNTFTVGDLEITLDEAKTDVYGTKLDEPRVTANTYKLVPGHTYTKDPVVHVVEGSEECWLFVEVVDALATIEADDTIAQQMVNKGWVKMDGNFWAYNSKVDAREAAKDVVVFEYFKLKGDADVSGYATADNEYSVIQIRAFAVQADGFDTAQAAWTATYGAPANP